MFKHMLRLGVAAMVAAGLGFAAGAEAAVKVAFVTNEAGLGDRSFNDMMHEGMKRAEKELGIEFSIVQPRTISDFQSTLSRTAATNGFDIIIGSSLRHDRTDEGGCRGVPGSEVRLDRRRTRPNRAKRHLKRDQGLGRLVSGRGHRR